MPNKPLILARRSDHQLSEDHYSLPKLAERYGEHPSVVRGWIKAGRLKWYRRRVSREEVLRFENANIVFVNEPEVMEAAQAARAAIRERRIERKRNPRNCIEEHNRGA